MPGKSLGEIFKRILMQIPGIVPESINGGIPGETPLETPWIISVKKFYANTITNSWIVSHYLFEFFKVKKGFQEVFIMYSLDECIEKTFGGNYWSNSEAIPPGSSQIPETFLANSPGETSGSISGTSYTQSHI